MGDYTIDGKDRETLRRALTACGFSLCGFARPTLPQATKAHYNEWLDRGYAGEMSWLTGTVDDRLDPGRRFPWARTAVCLALAYDRPEPRATGVVGRISRYAQGRSYHNLIRKRLKRVGRVLDGVGAKRFQGYCDTGPVAERQLAQAAGLGWIGKNTLLLDAHWGSQMFLAVGFSDLEIASDEPQTDHCGNCNACVTACPTSALVAPGVLDARRCISYLNIEHRGEYVAPYDADLHGWLHGCDICQDVCPFVQGARRRGRWGDPAFAPRSTWSALELADLADLSETEWDQATLGSDVRRGGPGRLRRVVRRLLGQSG